MFGGDGGGMEAARATLSNQVDTEPAWRQPASVVFIYLYCFSLKNANAFSARPGLVAQIRGVSTRTFVDL